MRIVDVVNYVLAIQPDGQVLRMSGDEEQDRYSILHCYAAEFLGGDRTRIVQLQEHVNLLQGALERGDSAATWAMVSARFRNAGVTYNHAELREWLAVDYHTDVDLLRVCYSKLLNGEISSQGPCPYRNWGAVVTPESLQLYVEAMEAVEKGDFHSRLPSATTEGAGVGRRR